MGFQEICFPIFLLCIFLYFLKEYPFCNQKKVNLKKKKNLKYFKIGQKHI